MSKVMSLRLREGQVQRLSRLARRLGRTPSETAAILLEESLRGAEHAAIVFRDTIVGRQAYLSGTRLSVWMTVRISREYGGDVAKTATHLDIPPTQVLAALRYAADYPDEIEDAIADNDSYDYERAARLLPNLENWSHLAEDPIGAPEP